MIKTGNDGKNRPTASNVKLKCLTIYCLIIIIFDWTPYILGNCSKEEFQCSNGRCIPRDWLCDGYESCSDGEDENKDNCGKLIFSAHNGSL